MSENTVKTHMQEPSDLKELRRRSCILKTLAKFSKIVISNPF